MSGDWGVIACSKSAEPEVDEEALLPCLLSRRRGDTTMDAVVDTLKVEWPSPPVPVGCQKSSYNYIFSRSSCRRCHIGLLCSSLPSVLVTEPLSAKLFGPLVLRLLSSLGHI